MKQAANLNIELPMFLSGIKVKTSPADYFPIEAMRQVRFSGEIWRPFRETIGTE